MVLVELRRRQNKEAYNEDLRANKKVFERQTQQIAVMGQSERPPAERIQTIAFQFNKDIENVKNALNDALLDMNTPDAVNRGFADFSKISLFWNKLVLRINPYIKGQQQDPNFQAATAGDINYVKQKLRDDLLQFFTNAVQQIVAFQQQGGGARVQNFPAVREIVQQLQTGFYKPVSYGAELRGALAIPNLPPNQGPQQGGPPPAGQPPAGQPPAGPQPQPQPAQPIPPPPPAQVVIQGNPPQGDADRIDPQQGANPQDLQLIMDYLPNMARDPQNFPDIFDYNNAPAVANIIEQIYTANYVAQGNPQPTQAQRRGLQQRIVNTLIPDFYDYYMRQQAQAQQGQPPQQGQPQPPQQGQPANPQQTPPRGLTERERNRAFAVQDKIAELGLQEEFRGYNQKTRAEKLQLTQYVQQIAAELQMTDAKVREILNRGTLGRGSASRTGGRATGGFLGGLIMDALASGVGSLAKSAYNLVKEGRKVREGGARRQGDRGRPIRLANDFTGLSEDPNTLAELKNRLRFSRAGNYVGDSTGAIIQNLQNRGVLGSGKRTSQRHVGGFISIPDDPATTTPATDPTYDGYEMMEPTDITGTDSNVMRSIPERFRDIVATQGRALLEASVNAMVQGAMASPAALEAAARAVGGAAAAALPPVLQAIRNVASATAQVAQATTAAARATAQAAQRAYQATASQVVLQYVSDYPEVLAPFLVGPLAGAGVAVAVGLARTYLRRDQQGRFIPTGRARVMERTRMDGLGRCCFNSGMCRGTKAYRFNYGEKSANVRKQSVRGSGMSGSGNGVDINVKYSKLPKALQPTEQDLQGGRKPKRASRGGVRRPRLSREGFQDEENDVYTHSGMFPTDSPLLHSEMLQDKALGLLKGMPRRIGVEDPKFKNK